MIDLILSKFPCLKYWRVGLFVLLTILMFWLLIHTNNQAYDRGFAAKSDQYDKALKEYQDQARAELAEMEKGYDTASKTIRALPSGGCVGAASRYSSQWLHSHYSPIE